MRVEKGVSEATIQDQACFTQKTFCAGSSASTTLCSSPTIADVDKAIVRKGRDDGMNAYQFRFMPPAYAPSFNMREQILVFRGLAVSWCRHECTNTKTAHRSVLEGCATLDSDYNEAPPMDIGDRAIFFFSLFTPLRSSEVRALKLED